MQTPDPHETLLGTAIGEMAMELLKSALEATEKTSRSSGVTINLRVKEDPDTEDIICSAQIVGAWPLNTMESKRTKLPAFAVLKIRRDCPGQTFLFGQSESEE